MTSTLTTRYTEIDGHHLRTNDAGLVLDECRRCGPENGNIEMYRNVNGGVCFKCWGHGGVWVTVAEMAATLKRRDADKARRDARRDKKAIALARKADRFVDANPIVARIMDYADADRIGYIAVDLRLAVMKYGELSEKQLVLVADLVDRYDNRERIAAKRAAEDAARKASAADAPTGRTVVTGEIVRVYERQNDYSYNAETVFSMLVRDDSGFEVWATMPGSIRFAEDDTDPTDLRGRRVTFTANLLPKAGDSKTASGKRPTKASLVTD